MVWVVVGVNAGEKGARWLAVEGSCFMLFVNKSTCPILYHQPHLHVQFTLFFLPDIKMSPRSPFNSTTPFLVLAVDSAWKNTRSQWRVWVYCSERTSNTQTSRAQKWETLTKEMEIEGMHCRQIPLYLYRCKEVPLPFIYNKENNTQVWTDAFQQTILYS